MTLVRVGRAYDEDKRIEDERKGQYSAIMIPEFVSVTCDTRL